MDREAYFRPWRKWQMEQHDSTVLCPESRWQISFLYLLLQTVPSGLLNDYKGSEDKEELPVSVLLGTALIEPGVRERFDIKIEVLSL